MVTVKQNSEGKWAFSFTKGTQKIFSMYIYDTKAQAKVVGELRYQQT